jgi:hypothetical protein
MNPEGRLLIRDPKIGLAHTFSTHPNTGARLLGILITNASVRNGVADVHTVLAMLLRETLRDHACRCPRSTICTVQGIGPHGAQGTRKDDGTLLLTPALGQELLATIGRVDHLQSFLCKRESAHRVDLHAVAKGFGSLLQEWLLTRMLHMIDGKAQWQSLEVWMCLDGLESSLKVCRLSIGWKGMKDSTIGRRAQRGAKAVQIVRVSRQKGNGKIALRWISEDTCNTTTLGDLRSECIQVYCGCHSNRERTEEGPAPIRMATPEGAIS